MEKDIVPELLELIEKEFDEKMLESPQVKKAIKLLNNKKATYKDANEFAIEVGEILSEVLNKNITVETLPDGRMYYNIADRIINPTMGKNYELISNYAADVQTQLNASAGLKIKGQKAGINQSRIDGIIERLSEEEDFDEIKWILDEPIKNFSQAIIDDTARTNIEFQARSGLSPKITRVVVGDCCDWCRELAGTYNYGDEPNDIYRRHRYCRCRVEYDPKDGRGIQDSHTKEWRDPKKDDKIEARKKIGVKDENAKILSSKKWLESEFSTEKKLRKHIKKHLEEYGNITEKEYLNIARKLLAESLSVDVEGFLNEANFIFKYRKSTNDFAIGREDGKISTLFKPDEGLKYWEAQVEMFKKKEV